MMSKMQRGYNQLYPKILDAYKQEKSVDYSKDFRIEQEAEDVDDALPIITKEQLKEWLKNKVIDEEIKKHSDPTLT